MNHGSCGHCLYGGCSKDSKDVFNLDTAFKVDATDKEDGAKC